MCLWQRTKSIGCPRSIEVDLRLFVSLEPIQDAAALGERLGRVWPQCDGARKVLESLVDAMQKVQGATTLDSLDVRQDALGLHPCRDERDRFEQIRFRLVPPSHEIQREAAVGVCQRVVLVELERAIVVLECVIELAQVMEGIASASPSNPIQSNAQCVRESFL